MNMDLPLLQNQFYILSVSTRDKRSQILEAAEQLGIVGDAEACSQAGSDLTNPRNRLAAELAWLPGISPRRVTQLLEKLRGDPRAIIYEEGVPTLARANLLSSAIVGLDPESEDADWTFAILSLGRTFDLIDVEEILRDLNEDRKVAGFTEIRSAGAVEELLEQRRREYRDCIKLALESLSPQKLARVCADVLDQATFGGETHAPLLIDELVDSYAVETQAFFTQEFENVRKLIARALEDASLGVISVMLVLDRLEIVLRNWAFVALPIALSAKAQGTSHEISRQMAGEVRSLGVDLFNEYKLLECSQRIVSVLQELFGMVSSVSDVVAEDSRTLDDIARKRDIEKRLSPLYQMAKDAAEKAEGSPSLGAQEANSLINNSKELIAELLKNGLPEEATVQAHDTVAVSVLRCCFAYGHKTLKWTQAIALLHYALILAKSSDTQAEIRKLIEIAKRNEKLFYGMTAVDSAPSLSTINGCGVSLYGNTDVDVETGSYMATYYFVFIFFPIFPICRYRVTSSGNSYRFLGKGKLRTFDKVHLAVSLALIAGFFLLQGH